MIEEPPEGVRYFVAYSYTVGQTFHGFGNLGITFNGAITDHAAIREIQATIEFERGIEAGRVVLLAWQRFEMEETKCPS